MNIRISICPTSLEYANGDRYDEGELLAALREYIEASYPSATISCLQVGHRQGDEFATIDGDSEAGEALVREFFEQHGADEELFTPEPPPVMVEVASCDETIRSLSGLEEVAGLEHHAMHSACEAYHRAATDAIIDAGGRLNWCVPHGQRLLHSGWAGAKFAFSRGAIGTMATDLTEAEKQQIAAADEAGCEAARKVIEAADAVGRANRWPTIRNCNLSSREDDRGRHAWEAVVAADRGCEDCDLVGALDELEAVLARHAESDSAEAEQACTAAEEAVEAALLAIHAAFEKND